VRRLLLIVNQNAYRVTRERRAAVTELLSRDFKLEEAATTRPGHGTELASEGVLDGVEIVAAFGGDGTVNEVVNGLTGTDVALAIVPGGMANVFARSLGIPNDAVAAATLLVDNAKASPRRVTLGVLDGRSFTSNCGVGFDASVVRRVEENQRAKKRWGDWFFVWSGLRVFFSGFDRRNPRVRVAWGENLEHRRDGLFLAIVQNTKPYTYLGKRPMQLCPAAELDAGLDFIALDSMGTRVALGAVLSSFGSGNHITNPHVLYVRDQRRIVVECDGPLPVQLDGEYIGERDRVVVEAAPNALSVIY
jgi:YegS/Rv2252/BmrU family lipid kinase